MKQYVKILILPLFLLTLCLAGCGHTHKPGNWKVETSAVCNATGTQVQKCETCGEVLDTRSYVVGHTYGNDNICTNCGKARYDVEELIYERITIDGREGYILVSKGNCGATVLNIPATYRSLPVLAIGERAFFEDTRLVEVHIPNDVLIIGKQAFAKCSALQTVTFGSDSLCHSIGESAFAECGALTAFALPKGVTEIAPSLFSGCEKLKKVTLHDALQVVGDDAFDRCEKLTTTDVDGIKYLGSPANPHLLAIGMSDKNQTALSVSENTKLIYAYAFAGCRKASSATLPAGLIYIGSYAFAGCTALGELSLPAGLVFIGNGVFSGCTALSSVALPAGLTSLGDNAFGDCKTLSEITLPNTLTHVGSNAFFGCDELIFTRHQNGFYLGTADNPHFLLVGYAAIPGDEIKHENTRLEADGAAGTLITQ